MKKEKILEKAKKIKKNVEKEQKLGESTKYAYYICKSILHYGDVKNLTFNAESKATGDYISRTVGKSDYVSLIRKVVKYVEDEKQLPNYVTYKNIRINIKLFTYIVAYLYVTSIKTGKLPDNVNINSKIFIQAVETPQEVVNYFKKVTGKNYDTIDGLLGYVKAYFNYLKYFDDKKSNKEVIDSKSGNCVDLLQFMINYAKAKGYDCKCIHVKCRVSGTGHVFGLFRHSKHTGGNWITRDIASVADGGSITSVWCEDGYKLAENPSWFLSNLNR